MLEKLINRAINIVESDSRSVLDDSIETALDVVLPDSLSAEELLRIIQSKPELLSAQPQNPHAGKDTTSTMWHVIRDHISAALWKRFD